jgi:hypothetical protein
MPGTAFEGKNIIQIPIAEQTLRSIPHDNIEFWSLSADQRICFIVRFMVYRLEDRQGMATSSFFSSAETSILRSTPSTAVADK